MLKPASATALTTTVSGSHASRPHGYRSSAPRRAVRSARTAISDNPTLANEYRPSNTISCEPVATPHTSATTAKIADVHIDNRSARPAGERVEVTAPSSTTRSDSSTDHIEWNPSVHSGTDRDRDLRGFPVA